MRIYYTIHIHSVSKTTYSAHRVGSSLSCWKLVTNPLQMHPAMSSTPCEILKGILPLSSCPWPNRFYTEVDRACTCSFHLVQHFFIIIAHVPALFIPRCCSWPRRSRYQTHRPSAEEGACVTPPLLEALSHGMINAQRRHIINILDLPDMLYPTKPPARQLLHSSPRGMTMVKKTVTLVHNDRKATVGCSVGASIC